MRSFAFAAAVAAATLLRTNVRGADDDEGEEYHFAGVPKLSAHMSPVYGVDALDTPEIDHDLSLSQVTDKNSHRLSDAAYAEHVRRQIALLKIDDDEDFAYGDEADNEADYGVGQFLDADAEYHGRDADVDAMHDEDDADTTDGFASESVGAGDENDTTDDDKENYDAEEDFEG